MLVSDTSPKKENNFASRTASKMRKLMCNPLLLDLANFKKTTKKELEFFLSNKSFQYQQIFNLSFASCCFIYLIYLLYHLVRCSDCDCVRQYTTTSGGYGLNMKGSLVLALCEFVANETWTVCLILYI